MKIYVTMRLNQETGDGMPVAAYKSEAMAKEAITKAEAAKAEFDRLYEQLVKPYSTGSSSSCSQRNAENNFPSKDGMFYATKEQAVYADKTIEFYERPEVKDCIGRDTGEDYIVTLELRE